MQCACASKKCKYDNPNYIEEKVQKLVNQKFIIAEQNEKIKTLEKQIEELKTAFAEIEDQQ